jgi:hypothetical protein
MLLRVIVTSRSTALRGIFFKAQSRHANRLAEANTMIRAVLFGVAIAFASSTCTVAQSILEAVAGLKFCQTLKDDAQRLKCYDGIKLRTSSDSPSATKGGVEIDWKIEETKSPLDDSPQVSGSLSSTKDDAALVLRCKERKTEAIFFKAFGFLGSMNHVKVLVRINDGKLIETRWSPSSSGTAVFAPSAVQFIKALPDKGKLFIRAFGFSGNYQEGEFKLGNVSEVRAKIAKACHWK